MAGFVLTRQASAGKWGAATYALEETGGQERHRGHRGHREVEPLRTRIDAPDADGTGCTQSNDVGAENYPKPPMPPMPSATPQQSTSGDVAPHEEGPYEVEL